MPGPKRSAPRAIRSRASETALSGKPTIVKPACPGATYTWTSIGRTSMPSNATVETRWIISAPGAGRAAGGAADLGGGIAGQNEENRRVDVGLSQGLSQGLPDKDCDNSSIARKLSATIGGVKNISGTRFAAPPRRSLPPWTTGGAVSPCAWPRSCPRSASRYRGRRRSSRRGCPSAK